VSNYLKAAIGTILTALSAAVPVLDTPWREIAIAIVAAAAARGFHLVHSTALRAEASARQATDQGGNV